MAIIAHLTLPTLLQFYIFPLNIGELDGFSLIGIKVADLNIKNRS